MKINSKTGAVMVLAAVAMAGCSSDKKSSKSATTTAPTTSNAAASPSGATVGHTRLAYPRGEHTATSTPSGVVVIGGEHKGLPLREVEIFQGGVWQQGGSLSVARKGHTATALSNGQVLVAGGQSDLLGAQVLSSLELYDPITRTHTPLVSMGQPRSGHVAARFTTAQGEFVLLAGGMAGGRSLASAEVYNVATNQLSPVMTPMAQDRVGAQALTLPNGKILIQGGLTGLSPTAVSLTPGGAEVFDPATGTFSPAGALGIDRFGAALTLTGTGDALLLGGNSAARIEATGEVYLAGGASQSGWTALTAFASAAREDLTLTALNGGDLLAVAGSNGQQVSNVVDLFAPRPTTVDGAFEARRELVVARRGHTANLLPNGNVLIVGGFDAAGGALASAEEYDAYAAPGTPSVQQPAAPISPPIPVQPPAPATPAVPAPQVLAMYPAKGKPGDLITIAGRNFGPKRQDNQVIFEGGVQGRVLFEVRIKRLPVLGPVETLIVEVPNGAQTGGVVVVTSNQSSAPKGFTVDLQSGGDPQILYTLPRKAKEGGFVTIFGRNFARPPQPNEVKFSGVPAQVIGGVTTQSVPFLGNVGVMLVRVPQGAVTGDLTVESYGKVSKAYRFEVTGTVPASQPSTGSNTGSQPGTGTTNPGSTPAPNTGATVYYSEDFEQTTVKMSEQGGLWQASRPGASGPSAAASGTWCAGTAMTQGAYSALDHGYLITSEVDLGMATTAELRFNQYFDTDGIDAGRVLVTTDGGNTWYLLRPRGGYSTTPLFTPGEGFTGQSNGWLATTVDLSNYAGQRIAIAFDFKADGVDQRAGWFLDDIVVSGN